MANACCCGYHVGGRDFTQAELNAHHDVCPWLKAFRELAERVQRNDAKGEDCHVPAV